MNHRLSIHFMLSVLLLMETTSSSSAQPLSALSAPPPPCDETEHFVEIEVMPHVSKIPGYNSLDINLRSMISRRKHHQKQQQNIIRDNSNNQTLGDEGDYFVYFDTLEGENNKFTKCIPKSECIRAQVKLFVISAGETRYDLSDKDVIIHQDGIKVPLSPAFPYTGDGSFVFAELGSPGSCEVTCNEGTTLLEIEGNPDSISFGWRLEDTNSGEILVHCFDSWTSDSPDCDWMVAEYFNPKICLPSDGCYRLVAGTSFLNVNPQHVETFNVTFGDNRIATWQDVQFESLDFSSGGEATTTCKDHGPCTDPNESLMEFFLWRDANRSWEQGYPDLDWELKSTNSSLRLAGGVVPKPADLRDLTYERQCVLKDACYKLELGVPRTIEITENFLGESRLKPYYEQNLYRVLLDGVIYNSNHEFSFGLDPYIPIDEQQEEPNFEEILFLGECQPIEVCPKSQESMLEINFSTGDRAATTTNIENTASSWLPYQAHWELHDDRGRNVKQVQTTFGSVTIGSDYRHYQCVTLEDTCLEFRVEEEAIESKSVLPEYSLFLDGVERTQRRQWDCQIDDDYYCSQSIVTRIGGDSCKSSYGLTPAAIACIVVVAIGAVAICIGFLVSRGLQRDTSSSNGEDTVKEEEDEEENGMGESTTSPSHDHEESDPQGPPEAQIPVVPNDDDDELYIRC